MSSLRWGATRLIGAGWIVDASIAGLLGLAAGLVRWLGMSSQSLWTDEISSLGLAYERLGDFFQNIAINAAHPPLYFLVVHILHEQLGLDPITALRAPSVVAGAAAVSVVYALGRVLVGRVAGLVASLLVLLSPFAVWYSREGRMYSLLWFLVLCSFAALAACLKTRRRFWLIPYSAFIALALYVDYSAIMALIPQGLLVAWLFLRGPRERDFLGWIVAAYVAGWLLYVPWLAFLPDQLPILRHQSFPAYPANLTTVADDILDAFNVRADYATMGPLLSAAISWAVISAYAAALLFAIRHWSNGWSRLTLSLTLGTAVVWILFFASGNQAVLVPRVVGILAFGAALLAGCALQVTWRHLGPAIPIGAPVVLVAGVLLIGSNFVALSSVEASGSNGAHWPEVSNYMATHAKASDAVIYYPLALKYAVETYLPPKAPARETGVGAWAGQDRPIQQQFELWAKGHPRIFMVFAADNGINVPLHDRWFQEDGYRRVSGDPTARMGVLEYVPVP